MLTDIKIGQYFPANSILHKLDARFKIVSLLFLIVGIFLGWVIYYFTVGELIMRLAKKIIMWIKKLKLKENSKFLPIIYK